MVVNFLTANALFWLDRYHFDGLRVDGVESMIRLDFRRQAGEWEPNRFGGNENLAAIEFLKRVNRKVHDRFPGTITIAEDASARPNMTRPPQVGGLGFDYKWDMGWVHDTLREYMPLDPQNAVAGPLQASLPHALRLQRELSAAAVARRRQPRQQVDPGQDARRRLGEAGQPAGCSTVTCSPCRARS